MLACPAALPVRWAAHVHQPDMTSDTCCAYCSGIGVETVRALATAGEQLLCPRICCDGALRVQASCRSLSDACTIHACELQVRG